MYIVCILFWWYKAIVIVDSFIQLLYVLKFLIKITKSKRQYFFNTYINIEYISFKGRSEFASPHIV